MEYTIISAYTAYSLENQVSVFLSSGWQPIGGVAVASWRGGPSGDDLYLQYSQALIKKDEWDE